eukprot:5054987-Amphidinium_carterae.2
MKHVQKSCYARVRLPIKFMRHKNWAPMGEPAFDLFPAESKPENSSRKMSPNAHMSLCTPHSAMF